jgi:hypothetical protein
MKHNNYLNELLATLRPPDPPAELRARTVAAASQALTESVRPDIWMRLWRSPALRVAWATSVLTLLAGHLLVTIDHRAVRAAVVTPPAPATTDRDPELRAIAALPRIDLDATSVELEADPRRVPENHEPATTPTTHRKKENTT